MGQISDRKSLKSWWIYFTTFQNRLWVCSFLFLIIKTLSQHFYQNQRLAYHQHALDQWANCIASPYLSGVRQPQHGIGVLRGSIQMHTRATGRTANSSGPWSRGATPREIWGSWWSRRPRRGAAGLGGRTLAAPCTGRRNEIVGRFPAGGLCLLQWALASS